MRGLGGVTALLAVVATTVVVACGGDSDSPPTVRTAFQSAQTAFAARDVQALCDTLSREAHTVLGSTVHRTPTTCRRDLPLVLSWFPKGGAVARGRIVEVAGTGDRRIATVAYAGSPAVELPFVREDGEWKLDGLYDATLSRIQARNTPREAALMPNVAGKAPEPTADGSFSVLGTGASRCRPLDTTRYPRIGGGCVAQLEGRRVSFSLQTPFGPMDFARCSLSFDLHVDGAGNAWAADPAIQGRQPCLDAMPCLDHRSEKIPWRGTLERSGERTVLKLDEMCLDTCLGRFTGPWEAELASHGRVWRLRSSDSLVGRTGWQIDGTLESVGAVPPLTIRS